MSRVCVPLLFVSYLCVCVCIPYGKQREGVRVNENGAFLIACAEWGKRS